jgi:hypothetical protein
LHVCGSLISRQCSRWLGVVALQVSHWDTALQQLEVAFHARGLLTWELRTAVLRNTVLFTRSEPADLAAIGPDVRTWRAIAIGKHQDELARQLDALATMARYELGDTVTAHADLSRLWQARPRSEPSAGSRKINGQVVDGRGEPIAGALVAASSNLTADSKGIGVPMFYRITNFEDEDLRVATSDERGRFVIRDAAPVGAIMAEFGEQRLQPQAIASHAMLVLEPTRSIHGKVDLGRAPYTRVEVSCLPIVVLVGSTRHRDDHAVDEFVGASVGNSRPIRITSAASSGRIRPLPLVAV